MRRCRRGYLPDLVLHQASLHRLGDYWKVAHDRDLRFAPCTAGLNHGAGVASASDLQGNFPQTGSCGGLRSRRRTFRYGALPHLSCACSAYLKNRKMERVVGGIFIEADMPPSCSHSCRQFLTNIQTLAHTKSEKAVPLQ